LRRQPAEKNKVHNYNFAEFTAMIADESRSGKYVAALREAVTEDSIVLDIGSGTGFFSLLACQFGAKKVYSIEPNPLIHLAQGFAAEYGYQDRIEFIQDLSTRVELPEKADILISDLRGSMPLALTSLFSVIDARQRLLKPEGVIIGQKDTIYFALAECQELYEKQISSLLKDFYGINMASARRLITNQVILEKEANYELVSSGQVFAELDYTTIEETSFSAKLEWEIEKKGTIHGLLSWFVGELGFGLTITNSPENPKSVYGTPFFPFDRPVEVEAGDKVEVSISADYVHGGYVWNWNTIVYSKNNSQEPKAQIAQSNVAGTFTPPTSILKQSEYFLPQPNEMAEINLLFLQSMDGEMLLGDIADILLEKFPDKFKSFEEAFAFSAELSVNYSK
jgi:type I protein arginine methyltransferase